MKRNLKRSLRIVTDLDLKEATEIFETGQNIGEGYNQARTLATLPSNKLNPSAYVKYVKERSKKLKYRLEYYDKKVLTKKKAGAFLAVIQGSAKNEGGILHLTYQPKTAKKNPFRLALVGKGLCFDTGGNNIKTSHMFGMHRDMTGSAIALAIFECLVKRNVNYEVHAYLALAENLISPESYRPNDIVIASDGTSIEIVDTDAEGRLVLADTLALARKLKPSLTLDFATLTGAAIRAIGTKRCAVFSNDSKLLTMAQFCGEISGERVWGFPIGDEYRELINSDSADILQCTLQSSPDHICAATFLSHFIGDTPWVHCDLTAEHTTGGLGLIRTDTTGFGIRWALEFVSEFLKRS